jgi:hypothetical protein
VRRSLVERILAQLENLSAAERRQLRKLLDELDRGGAP